MRFKGAVLRILQRNFVAQSSFHVTFSCYKDAAYFKITLTEKNNVAVTDCVCLRCHVINTIYGQERFWKDIELCCS